MSTEHVCPRCHGMRIYRKCVHGCDGKKPEDVLRERRQKAQQSLLRELAEFPAENWLEGGPAKAIDRLVRSGFAEFNAADIALTYRLTAKGREASR